MNGKIAARIGAFTAIFCAVVVIFVIKGQEDETPPPNDDGTAQTTPAEEPVAAADPLPMLVEFGSDSCIPCKKMKPILDALTADFAGQFKVDFHDIRKNPAIGREHNIRVMPTQVFFDEEGNELFRHEGFFSRNDILKVWEEHLYMFTPNAGDKDNAAAPTTQVLALYLHNTVRCVTCLEIEATAKAVIESSFAGHIDSGDLMWQALDMEQPEHAHYEMDFMLTAPSLVLARSVGGSIESFTVLDKTWDFAHTTSELEAYISAETEQFISGDNADADA